ncbi:hypothetical protein P8T85_10830 [Corynebacterium rouxii]|uniref:ABC transporter permease n=1 Tax=Corynebacterium rouxii TaxID=2719119 RepID=A0ABU3PQ56_9CORY|nr:hypothetical protein [Corynebacterium rouxii]MDT9409672.1 hypothetical protein [Corynebacterium rouxii]MDT9411906.1 hypothetical protein [Corynebacterium rouxii]
MCRGAQLGTSSLSCAARGTPLDRPDSLIVPALAIALVGGAWLQRLVRAAIVDAAALPHVRAAHLAGHHSAAVA